MNNINSETAFVYTHRVQYYETDRMGISHHSNHVRWMEEARMAFFESCGADYAQLEKKGIRSPVVAIECRYKAPSTFWDELSISTKIDFFNGVRLRLCYVFSGENGQLIAEGMTEHCFVNAAGTVLNMKKACPEFWQAIDKTLF